MPSTSLQNFDPNGPGNHNNTVFGLPFTEETASLVIIPVPWDATVSYREGTALGPEQIRESSYQVDLYDTDAPDLWKQGIYMSDNPEYIHQASEQTRELVSQRIEKLENQEPLNEADQEHLQQINTASARLNEQVYTETKRLLKMGKHVALLGGDHSTPLGHMRAIAEKYPTMSVLQIDAHMDLRRAYEGFTYSHASIMQNMLSEIPSISKLVQVGLRDYCDEEVSYAQTESRIVQFFSQGIKEALYQGSTYSKVVDDILAALGEEVYISFDIDGLDPTLCPHTGTPVPGGLGLEEAYYLCKRILDSGRRIVSFDLCEVAGDEDNTSIDSIVGARLLYKLSLLLLKSHG